MNDLFIPTKLNNNNFFSKGIGKKEFKQIVVGTLIGLLIGCLIGIIFFHGIRIVLIVMVICGLLFALSTHFIVLKSSINLSVYIFIGILKRYISEQKYYKYKKLKEWG